MPFGLKNAPMIYQRMIDNALWGYVQPKGGWGAFAKRMAIAEAEKPEPRQLESLPEQLDDVTTTRTKFAAAHDDSATMDPVLQLINHPDADMFTASEPDESSLVPVFDRRSFVDDICFGGRTFEDCLHTLDRLLSRFEDCRISVSFTKSIFVQRQVDFLSHGISRDGIRANPKKMAAITELTFPRTKKGMQSFLGALNYYNRFIQDFAVYGAALYQLKDDDFAPGGDLSVARRCFATLQQKVATAPILRHFDRAKEVHVMLFANEWALSSTLLQMHDEKLHPVRFCGRVLKDTEMNYHPAEKEVLALLLLLKTCYTQLTGKTLRVYTRFSTLEWITKSKSLFGRAVQFAVLLSPWHLIVQRVKESDCAFIQLLQSTVTSFVNIDESLEFIAPPTKGSPTTRLDPNLLYARLPTTHTGLVVSFDGSAKTEKYGGYGSCSWIVWRLPEWQIVIAASAYLEKTTVNMAEYMGVTNGVLAALEHGAEDLVIVGDSRLAIQQSLGVIACRKESLMTQLSRHKEITAKLKSVKYLHVLREYNAAADSLATEALESKVSKVVLSEDRKKELKNLNRIQEMLYVAKSEEAEVQNLDPGVSIQILDGTESPRPKTYADFIHDEPCRIMAMTRSQAKTTMKQVRFAKEPQKEDATDITTSAETETLPEQIRAPPAAPSADDIDPVEVQSERRRRIATAQGEELRWSDLKAVLRGEVEKLGYKAARNAWKLADKFVLSEDGVLYYIGASRRRSGEQQEEVKLRLVVPTTMIQEVLQNCHDSLEGGHQGVVRTYQRVKRDYYWLGLYADVERHAKSCPDCSTSKSRPQLRGYSPGNVLAERPLQIVSMDFVDLYRRLEEATQLCYYFCAHSRDLSLLRLCPTRPPQKWRRLSRGVYTEGSELHP
ncbi:hypothetical protein PF003_g30742 [Phytophthora fragariae]|nr:hypothetical protein PF003_g30742 [Phytophthora fragariae]